MKNNLYLKNEDLDLENENKKINNFEEVKKRKIISFVLKILFILSVWLITIYAFSFYFSK